MDWTKDEHLNMLSRKISEIDLQILNLYKLKGILLEKLQLDRHEFYLKIKESERE